MTLELQIQEGAEGLISFSAATSDGDPPLAVAQMVLGAASICFTSGITEEQFRGAVELAIAEVWPVA